jgi:Acetyltransferases, including N-acetylases of ribosomal proteins
MTIETAFTHFPALTTNRLELRQIETMDANALFAIKSDVDVTRHYGQEPHQSLEDTLGWIRRLQDDYARREALFWCLTLKGEDRMIGECVFWNFDAGFHCAEIGYELHPAYWQQGLMSEALSAVLTYGFNELGLHRIEANPLAENTSSKSLLVKLGFIYEGNLRQRHFFRGHFEDQLYFGLLKQEWPKAT